MCIIGVSLSKTLQDICPRGEGLDTPASTHINGFKIMALPFPYQRPIVSRVLGREAINIPLKIDTVGRTQHK